MQPNQSFYSPTVSRSQNHLIASLQVRLKPLSGLIWSPGQSLPTPGPDTQLGPISLLQPVSRVLTQTSVCLSVWPAAAASTFQPPSLHTSDDVTALESISTDKLMQSGDLM